MRFSFNSAVLVFAVAGASIWPLPAHAQRKPRVATPTRWEIVDANGNAVGVPVDFGYGADATRVAVRVNDSSFFLLRVGQGYVLGEASTLYYESLDCVGQAYIPSLDPVDLDLGNAAAYYADGAGNTDVYLPTGPPQTISSVSRRNLQTGGCQNNTTGGSMVPASVGYSLQDILFPLAIRLVP